MADFNSADFRVAASDTRGHNRRCEFRAQPGHIRQVEEIISSRKFPYRQRGDLYRHALLVHLRVLERMAPVNSTTAKVDLILECMRDDENAADFRDSFNKLGERIAYHQHRGAEGEVRRLVLFTQRAIFAMPDGYWRDAYLKEIKGSYGKWMEEAPKASLSDFSDD